MDQGCNRGKNGSEKSEECHDRHGLAPIVQNSFNGVRYCGKRSVKAFNEFERPIKDPNDSNRYKCRDGYVACNEDFFDQPGGEDYVICRRMIDKETEECPITSIKFKIT
mmetsp:Transcript_22465/g.27691  ORF Transcript_22465/g.27691 Transcript_22465/m.27691 type:complete len:109 (+) Transcript_22465:359-685(+)